MIPEDVISPPVSPAGTAPDGVAPPSGAPPPSELAPEKIAAESGGDLWQLLLMAGVPPGPVETSIGPLVVNRHGFAVWVVALDLVSQMGAQLNAISEVWRDPVSAGDEKFSHTLAHGLVTCTDQVIALVRLMLAPKMPTREAYWKYVQQADGRDDRFTDDFVLCELMPDDVFKIALRFMAVNNTEALRKNLLRLAQLGSGLVGPEARALAMIGSLSSRPQST